MPDLFFINGSFLRLKELEASFDSPPGYGRDLDWSGYTVHDAAAILVRFLLRLPEPVIPPAYYEDFRRVLKPYWPLNTWTVDHIFDKSKNQEVLRSYQRLVLKLDAPSRELLTFLLHSLEAVGPDSDHNRKKLDRIAVIFQPALLSPIASAHNSNKVKEHGLSQLVIIFLVLNAGSFCCGADLNGMEVSERVVSRKSGSS